MGAPGSIAPLSLGGSLIKSNVALAVPSVSFVSLQTESVASEKPSQPHAASRSLYRPEQDTARAVTTIETCSPTSSEASSGSALLSQTALWPFISVVGVTSNPSNSMPGPATSRTVTFAARPKPSFLTVRVQVNSSMYLRLCRIGVISTTNAPGLGLISALPVFVEDVEPGGC